MKTGWTERKRGIEISSIDEAEKTREKEVTDDWEKKRKTLLTVANFSKSQTRVSPRGSIPRATRKVTLYKWLPISTMFFGKLGVWSFNWDTCWVSTFLLHWRIWKCQLQVALPLLYSLKERGNSYCINSKKFVIWECVCKSVVTMLIIPWTLLEQLFHINIANFVLIG